MGNFFKNSKTIFLSSLGGGLEYYDFVIFIIFAEYIGKNFSFSEHESQIAQLFFSFSLFAVGYLARPLGGILFSHIGDKFGRKKAFSLSIVIMALSTFAMGILPSYQTIGIAATIIFTLLRIIQGLSLGGELPGAITFLNEHCQSNAGLALGVLFAAVNIGIVLADGVHAALAMMLSKEALMLWGWRFAFFIGSSLAILAYFMRKRLEETPNFLLLGNQTKKIPLKTLIKSYPSNLVLGLVITILPLLAVSILMLYINSYLQIFSYEPKFIAHTSLFNALALCCCVIIFGLLADRWNPQNLLAISSLIFLCLSPIVCQQIRDHGQYMLVLLSLLSISIGGTMIGSMLILANIFPTAVRYSGIAFCYNINAAIFGGLAPMLANFLILEKGIVAAPSLLLQVAAVFSLLSLIYLELTSRKSSMLPT